MTTDKVEITVLSELEDRYSRLRLAGWQPDVLQSARILVAGAGALGNEVIKNLALLGIGSLLIVDFDTVELSNLSRSVLFRPADLGRRKAEVAAQNAKTINPDIDIAWFHGDLNFELGTGVFRHVDLVIGCLDNQAARLKINRNCYLANKPWVDGALDGMDGLARVFIPQKGPCFECTLTEADYADLRRRFSCQGIVRGNNQAELIPTTTTSAALVAALQVEQAVRLLHNLETLNGYELIYSSKLNELSKVKVKEKEWCLSHEVADPVEELTWATVETTTFRQLLNAAQQKLGIETALSLDREIVTHLICENCLQIEEKIAAAHHLRENDLVCSQCNRERTIISTHQIDDQSPFLDSNMNDLGIPPGHIIRARKNGEYCYFELSGDFPAALASNRVNISLVE